jgi:general secretion pathway protein B
MSFILDALRKSEIERQRQSGPSMAEFPVAREDRRFPMAMVAIGVLLAVNAAVVLFFVLRDKGAPAAAATQVALATPASVTSAPPPGAAPATPPLQPPAPGAPPEAANTSTLESAFVPADELGEPPAETYGAPATLPPDAPDPTLIPETPPAQPHPGVVYSPGTSTEDAATVAASTGLPELTVDLHVYSENPAKRSIFINGRRYVQGDHIAEGPVVEQITPDGAMLSYRGRRFLLPRL